jgi:hypothetical protein
LLCDGCKCDPALVRTAGPGTRSQVEYKSPLRVPFILVSWMQPWGEWVYLSVVVDAPRRGEELVFRLAALFKPDAQALDRRSYRPPMTGEAAYHVLLDMDPKLDKDLVRAFKFASHVDYCSATA